jgi:hypothetical protein
VAPIVVIVRGSSPFPGGKPKEACDLCDPHLVLVVWHPIMGLACDAN